jgi:hypothetical protein
VTREVTLREPVERDDCIIEHFRRPARDGRAWARYCDVHARLAAPTDGVETLGYHVYRERVRSKL